MKRASVTEARSSPGDEQALIELVRRGVAVPPRVPIDVERFLNARLVPLSEGPSASEIIVAQRRAHG